MEARKSIAREYVPDAACVTIVSAQGHEGTVGRLSDCDARSATAPVTAAYFAPGTANAMMLSSVNGAPKNPPPADVITTYCLPSLPR